MFLSTLLAPASGYGDEAYAVSPSKVAYQITLFENGDHANPRVITGLYSELNPKGEKEYPECAVTTSRRQNGQDTHWEISVVPKGDWGVFEVDYPVLFLPKLTNDFLVTGRRIGQRQPMSYYWKKGPNQPDLAQQEAMREGMIELAGKKCLYFSRYPSSTLTLQLIMYEDGQKGVMIWTPDDECWVKDFVLTGEFGGEKKAKEEGCLFYMAHYPCNTGQRGTAFKSPYPVVTTPYTGTWYDAALIYKDWARKQWWCDKGKIYNRPETPAWFKEMQTWYCIGWYQMRSGFREGEGQLNRYVPGKIVGYQFYQWEESFNVAGYSEPFHLGCHDREALDWILSKRSNGLYPFPYINLHYATMNYDRYKEIAGGMMTKIDGTTFDVWWRFDPDALLEKKKLEQGRGFGHAIPESYTPLLTYKERLRAAWIKAKDDALINEMDRFELPEAVRTKQKDLLRENWGKDPKVIDTLEFYQHNATPCLASSEMHGVYMRIADDVLGDFKAGALYLDCFPLSPMPCYNKAHGHALGYGKYVAQANRKVLQDILTKYPGTMFACESGSAEYLMDCMHVTYMKGIDCQAAIPLLPVVYNGFLMYCNWWIWAPFKKTEDFTTLFAKGIHLGYLPGGAVGGGILGQLALDNVPPDDIKARWVNEIISIRLHYKDYLCTGERLNDLPVAGSEKVEARWNNKGGATFAMVNCPLVTASLWQKDGDVSKGLLLMSNAGKTVQKVTIGKHGYKLEPYEWKTVEVALPFP